MTSDIYQWDCAGCAERITTYPPGAFDPDDRAKMYCHGCYDEPEQNCIACGSPAVIGTGSSMMHGFTYAVCAEHRDEGYEHAMAEHQPCDC